MWSRFLRFLPGGRRSAPNSGESELAFASDPADSGTVNTELPEPDASNGARRKTVPDRLSAQWAAARTSPLIYAHKLRLEPNQHSGAHAGTPAVDRARPAAETFSDAGGTLPSAFVHQENNGAKASSRAGSNHRSSRREIDAPFLVSRQASQNEEASKAATIPRQVGAAQQEHQSSQGADDPNRFALLHAVANQMRSASAGSRYLFVVGSTTEARKVAPVIRILAAQEGMFGRIVTCAAGERPDRTREALALYGIKVDLELSISTREIGIEEARTRLITGFGRIYADSRPDWIVVQGSSATAAMASIAAYYAQIRVAHLDGGTPLDQASSFDESDPEVLHRLIASLFASVHFTETALSKESLLREGVPEECVVITGNTGVDVMHETCAELGIPVGSAAARSSGVVHVLVVAELAETIELHLPNLCVAIRNLAVSVPGLYQFVWPVQADAKGLELVNHMLDRVPGVLLSGPATYEHFLHLLSECDLVLTDLEDVQEEAPSLGKPVLLMRPTTSRPEALRTGITTLTGTEASAIQSSLRTLARKLSVRHGAITNPYGDGKASLRILDFLQGRQVLEFGKTTLPRLVATAELPQSRRIASSSLAS